MTIRAVDCQGFAGGFTLGAVQAGLHLVGKREMQAGFGVANCEANRHLLGYDWSSETVDPSEWSVPDGGAHVVFGNPPCSGFSGLSSKHFRGVDSPINHCMWAFVGYAARVMPLIAVFESVRTAYSKGRTLMQQLRAKLEEDTATRWDLHHVVHEANSLGGPAVRRRYFWVATRIRFGVEYPALPFAATLRDAIGDLENLDYTWLPQPYVDPATRWSATRRSETGTVDGHMTMRNPLAKRFADIAEAITWHPGENISQVTRRCYEEHGALPQSWAGMQAKLVSTDFNFGFNAMARWDYDKPGRVITGIGPNQAVHPTLNRMLTHRETARIMGFPDDWRIMPIRDTTGLAATWGKGITVDAGRWIATWVKNSIEGHPGSYGGSVVGDREFEVVVSKPVVSCGTVSSAHTQVVRSRSGSPSISPVGVGSPITRKVAAVMSGEYPEQAPASDEAAPVVTFNPGVPAEAESATEPATSESSPRRGRPRPADVVARDEVVYGLITDDGVTRDDLVAKLDGVEPFHEMDEKTRGTRVYQSLWRLRRDGYIQRGRDGSSHTWHLVSDETTPAELDDSAE